MDEAELPAPHLTLPRYPDVASAFAQLGYQLLDFLEIARQLGTPLDNGSLAFAAPVPSLVDAWEEVQMVSVMPQLCMPSDPELFTLIPDGLGNMVAHYKDRYLREQLDYLQSFRKEPWRMCERRREWLLSKEAVIRLETHAKAWIDAAPWVRTPDDLMPLPEAIQEYHISRSTIDRSDVIKYASEGGKRPRVYVSRRQIERLVAKLNGITRPPRTD